MNDNIIVKKLKDGRKYSIRKDRHRYFFPQEWNKFESTFKNKKHLKFFLTLLHTGSRTMEALHIKAEHFDFERQTITFNVVKQRKAKKKYSSGKTRTFFVSKKYLRDMKGYIKQNKIKPDDYLFLDNNNLPSNYESLGNIEKKKYYGKTQIAYAQLFKRKLKKAGIKDWDNFSLHNIRKTYGNWMRLYDIKMEELCYRMGHDAATYLEHYGSSLIFTPSERQEINRILGEVK